MIIQDSGHKSSGAFIQVGICSFWWRFSLVLHAVHLCAFLFPEMTKKKEKKNTLTCSGFLHQGGKVKIGIIFSFDDSAVEIRECGKGDT